jgi:flavin reductase (DIM6/NTAB) family NADH-FMN oxidoreductase RutF
LAVDSRARSNAPISAPEEHWDRLFAPSSCLATITTVNAEGRVNAASFGTCTRISHAPVTLAFAVGAGKDTHDNVLATGEFVVNLPAFERRQLEQVRIAGLNFAPGVSELEAAGLEATASTRVRPPRIASFGRHFECRVLWTRQWRDRLLVVGDVVAVSYLPGIADEHGYLVWDRARPAHYCGWPYDNSFVAAFEVTSIDMTYAGPEAGAGERPIPRPGDLSGP